MSETTLTGVAASPGLAVGVAYRYAPLVLALPAADSATIDQAGELARFHTARDAAKQEIQTLQANLTARAGKETADIFAAHSVLLFDPALESAVKTALAKPTTAEHAVDVAGRELAQMLLNTGDETLAGRAADVMDITRRVIRLLLGVEDHSLASLDTPSIIVADELSPSDTAMLDPKLALGICLAGGGATSHAAILARTLAIPAVVALGADAITQVKSGDMLAINGKTGQVILRPSEKTTVEYQRIAAEIHTQTMNAVARAHEDARTADGQRVEVQANVGGVESAKEAVSAGAEGVGLLRTEFLYLKATQPPTEDAQISMYRDLLAALGERPVTFRTMDLGGDKPPSFMDFPEEMNPFLGWRGIRVSLDRDDLFKTQLRALLQASAGRPGVSIMFPMIEGVETLDAARAMLDAVRAELDAAGTAYARDVQVGIMVETPAAAVLADQLAPKVDFFSIGTNDLTQYTLAADRDNGHVAPYFRMTSPAVLRLVKMTIDAGHAAGKKVSMCGELAGYPPAIPVLLGLGLDKFSMVAAAIPQAKQILRELTTSRAAAIAAHALTLPTAAAIEAYVRENVPGV